MYIIEKRHRLQGCNLYIPRDLNCLSRYDPPLSYRRSKRTLGISWDCSLFFLSWPEEGLYIERHSEFRGFCVIILFLFFFARVVGYSSIGCNRISREGGGHIGCYTQISQMRMHLWLFRTYCAKLCIEKGYIDVVKMCPTIGNVVFSVPGFKI